MILGLDLARITGLAVLNPVLGVGLKPQVMVCQSRELGKPGDIEEQLKNLAHWLVEIFKNYPIGQVAIEDIFLPVKTSRKTPIILGELRGVARFISNQAGKSPIFLTPLKVKQGITGSGASKKEEVKNLLEAEFSIQIPDDNASDALGVAYYHFLCGGGENELD